MQQSDALIEKHAEEGRAKDERIKALEAQIAAMSISPTLSSSAGGSKETDEQGAVTRALQDQLSWAKRRMEDLEEEVQESHVKAKEAKSRADKEAAAHYAAMHSETLLQQEEMNVVLAEQKELIIELEDERRASQSMVVQLKNKIRKLEMAQFEMAEADSFGSSQRGSAIASPPGSRSRSRDVTSGGGEVGRRLKEVEAMLERERALRIEEQEQSTERIASLEAGLTVTKAKLRVANLQNGM
jgi:hypothetical protein